MADEAISGAIGRLQAAIDGLETAVEAVVAAPAVIDSRDEKLRAEVQAVIAELDRMIGVSVAEVTLTIGGHHYALTCADGEEQELIRLGGLVDEQVAAARAAVGGLTEVRQLLFSALFLADKLETDSAAPDDSAATVARIDAMAEHIARLSARLAGA